MKLYEAVLTFGMLLTSVIAIVGLFSYQMPIVIVSALLMLGMLYMDDRRRQTAFKRKMNEDKA